MWGNEKTVKKQVRLIDPTRLEQEMDLMCKYLSSRDFTIAEGQLILQKALILLDSIEKNQSTKQVEQFENYFG